MSATALNRSAARKDEANAVISAFWEFSSGRVGLSESERLVQIRAGFSASLFQAIRVTFGLPERSLETLLNASISTLERRRREHKNLDLVASERLDRIGSVCHLAEEVFESREEAVSWMSRANRALGGQEPVMLCETEIGARQVRRVLHAIEWGGAA
ncbi:putative uncharacterized protein [Pseudomonas sp. StFLB209]|uniref:type II RES/Xre toxin-antitoxin system antitoxin n=1 Tax=Pseudomonas sp. StFLB209 TaxID=1028989 RepID=UPI0004F8FD3C|nr:antitoxin Xre/MbcA/ParS toxin-binding domain-containing protein [Pseudomonas sp. StFLB209]BAP41973.1 putative uncharacterized protein [Pseudomonas sp. StFLB209]